MNCEEFRQLAQAIARDEALDAATLERALSHADSCESCDGLLEESETLTGELRALSAYYAAESAPRHLEAQLMAVVGQQREFDTRTSSGSWLSATLIGLAAEFVLAFRRKPAALLGAAAAVVLVLALSGRPAALWHPSRLATFGHAGQAPASEPTASPQLDAQTVDSDATLTADSFVPLSGTYDLASLNDDPIVRVVLSDDDLESLGLPVGDSGDEQVVADLIIANDGTPQAIRVVSW